ncbi:MAG: nucleotide pyrophosphohydrolase [Candidatus Woesearchaeota archaeon]|jgi:NTP pyrophosphatase (non-canonical NTP hydrolase)
MDNKTTIQDMKNKVKTFCDERDWEQFHNAKELAIGIVLESSEILEHFRFKSEKEIEEMFKDTKKKEEISEEIADTLFGVFRMAQKYDIDLSTVFDKKFEKNAMKYPVDKFKGNNKKYDEL